LYTTGHVLQTEKRLYELEKLLDEKTFFRASKSVIVNLNKITKLKPEVTRNILATLTNGEVIVISRRNVKALKELIGVEG
jgi:DNA-binding LytR/AlgR family response regulator